MAITEGNVKAKIKLESYNDGPVFYVSNIDPEVTPTAATFMAVCYGRLGKNDIGAVSLVKETELEETA